MDESKAILVLAQLNRLTQEGRLDWRREPAEKFSYPGGGDFDVVYVARHEGKSLGLFELSYRDYSGETDEWYTATRVVVAFFDERGKLEWEFPRTPNAVDLLEAIRFKTAGVEDYFDKILKDGG